MIHMGDDFSRFQPEPRDSDSQEPSLEQNPDHVPSLEQDCLDQQARDATNESMLENGRILPEDV